MVIIVTEYKAPEKLWKNLDTILVSPEMKINPNVSPNLTSYIHISEEPYKILTKEFSKLCDTTDLENVDKEIIKAIVISYNNQYEPNELIVNLTAIRPTNSGYMLNFTCNVVANI